MVWSIALWLWKSLVDLLAIKLVYTWIQETHKRHGRGWHARKKVPEKELDDRSFLNWRTGTVAAGYYPSSWLECHCLKTTYLLIVTILTSANITVNWKKINLISSKFPFVWYITHENPSPRYMRADKDIYTTVLYII